MEGPSRAFVSRTATSFPFVCPCHRTLRARCGFTGGSTPIGFQINPDQTSLFVLVCSYRDDRYLAACGMRHGTCARPGMHQQNEANNPRLDTAAHQIIGSIRGVNLGKIPTCKIAHPRRQAAKRNRGPGRGASESPQLRVLGRCSKIDCAGALGTQRYPSGVGWGNSSLGSGCTGAG